MARKTLSATLVALKIPLVSQFVSNAIANDREQKTIRDIVATEFDPAYYLAHQPDVKRAKIDPLEHFLDYGWKEGRNPNAIFDCRFYLATHKAVKKAGINPFHHFLTVGRARGFRFNPAGTRPYPPMKAPSASDWAGVTAAANLAEAAYVVIMPVYKGYDETLDAIFSVLTARQKTPFVLHVINDRSPDAALDRVLEDLASRTLFSYAKNAENLGFVKSVNAGLRLFASYDVILLNADAKVFGDWIDRIDRHAKSNPRIATITPLSNNATICSYPVANENNIVALECSAETLDRYAATCNAGRATEIPTGIGFCFFMSRASREAVGILDEVAFGRGYGEENDFCLRAANKGFLNVAAEDIFVYHAGQVSFADFIAVEYQPGQDALLRKHPDYPTRIDQYLDARESALGRMRLDLFRLARDTGDCMVFVYHALSGGIVTHVHQMETRLNERGIKVVHIKVGVSDRWSVQVGGGPNASPYCPNLEPVGFNQFRPLLETFIGWLRPRAIHVHSLVGFDWVATTGFMDFIRASAVPYYFTAHDYSVFCHRNDLILPTGRFCGLPDVAVCRTCVSRDGGYREALDPATRREAYNDFLSGAEAVFTPSNDVAARLARAGARFPIVVRPHEDTPGPGRVDRRDPNDPLIHIVTIGAIGVHKGSYVLRDLARDAKARALPIKFHIVGYSDMTDAMLAAGVDETGAYDSIADALEILAVIRPTAVLLPSIWPETFCYALSMAFDFEIPPIVFDLGAQRDRVVEAGFGFVIPYDLVTDIIGLNDRLVSLPYATQIPARDTRTSYPDILRDYYAMAD